MSEKLKQLLVSDNTFEYNRLYKIHIWTIVKRCWLCGLYEQENASKRAKRQPKKSWKMYRRTQYKNV